MFWTGAGVVPPLDTPKPFLIMMPFHNSFLFAFTSWIEFERPINAANNRGASHNQKQHGKLQSKALEAITKSFMLRRLQKDILKTLLPPRKEFLLFCKPSVIQRQLYTGLTRKLLGRATESATPDALVVLTDLRKLCCHPGLIDTTIQTDHKGNNSAVESPSGKLALLQGLLSSIRSTAKNDKVVIVSNFTTALTFVEGILKRNGMTFCRLDGSTELSNRQNLVDSFNRTDANKCFAFLLSSKSGGCGLNLIGGMYHHLALFQL